MSVTNNSFTMPAADVTVKAVFELIPAATYTVAYNANNGTGTMASDTVIQGANYTIKANSFTRSNYNFA
ncbi:MAG: hypothetical protein LBS19_01915, partial [Clostridiales bacterium]|nr:hypothetical protein [Clostridiales bacterium]